MSTLLIWLALPLLISPWLADRDRWGGAIGRIVMAGFGLAALHQGAGTLDLVDLRTIAAESTRDAWFVAATAGWMIGGSCIVPGRRWREALPALPLLGALLMVAWPHAGPLLLGLCAGAIPAFLGQLLRGTGRVAESALADETLEWPRDPVMLALAVATVVAAVLGPTPTGPLGLVLMLWRGRRLAAARGGLRAPPLLELAATLLIVAWTAAVVTIAGSWLPSLRAMAHDAPISPAAGQGLALLALGWAGMIAAPWPLDRRIRSAVRLPVLAVVIHLAGMHVTPDGIAHWQPIVTTLLVASTLGALASGRWDGAAAALMLLSVTRGGNAAFVAAMAVALAPAIRRSVLPAAARSALAGVAIALVIVGMLRDQVLLSVILAAGVATLANRADRIVARGAGPVHL